ncbi:MAG: SagB/ThcOx family dehydrogenase [Planctomycetota bacterium]
MKEILLFSTVIFLLTMLFFSSVRSSGEPADPARKPEREIKLPPPQTTGKISLEESILKRRSVRKFGSDELTPEQISQLCWAAQGITGQINEHKLRAAPSAGGIYPMALYLVKKDGFYQYLPESHSLQLIKPENLTDDLTEAALGQRCIKTAPVNFIITGDYAKCAKRYGNRDERYVQIEVGHIAQNIHLQAVTLGLGSVPVGAFDDDLIKDVLNLSAPETPLYIIPVGYPAK